jgi:hypothetical protein
MRGESTASAHNCRAQLPATATVALLIGSVLTSGADHAQPKGEICPDHPKNESCPLPPRCIRLSATGTDPEMRWHCQDPNKRPSTYRHYTDCTDEHVVCTPPADSAARQQLVVFFPGTGLVPQDYSLIVNDFANSHGFHAIGLMYPSTQGQSGCEMSRVEHPTDLNCTARERLRVLTGTNISYGSTETHTNITTPDSIVNRLAKALSKLGPPWSGWLLPQDGSPDWANIIVSGHSNGADHTGFAAKTFNVSRALMFAGANDMVGPKATQPQCVPQHKPYQKRCSSQSTFPSTGHSPLC